MTFCGVRFAVSHEKPDAKGLYYLNKTGVKFKNSKLQKARSWQFTNMAEKLNSELSTSPGVTPYDGLYGEAKPSLQASSPIWASEAYRARKRERAAKPRGVDDYFSRYTPNGELARRLSHARKGYLFPGFRYMKG